MRPQLHKLPLKDCSFLYKNWHCDYFDKPWHFHEEYELVMIEKSKGTKFIGEKVSDFEEGDLMLLAPRIPHFFRNNVNYYKRNGRLEASSIFIHFSEDFLGKNFFDLPEMKLVQKLLENAQYAVEIQGDVKPYIIDRLHRMNGESAAQRLVSLLDILVKISERADLNPVLSSTLPKGGSTEAGGDQEISRINTIFDYITNNFRREIYVHEIAEKLFMSKASFSRFFKHHTRKTFSDYVTEMRISHACKLLMNEDQNITQISFESGFENLSNFYKHFRRITGVIPKEYRRRFLETGL
ncbi:AraC family transcriptional regulator [Segetibacter koreensis]|uniref:AraC family transcriptional regulator n=1 Tax=Segetibacter koreensis TaxID=398037 RepID=UPI0003690515|nr:AraC family transcriptional regulator [Segetibacter koreensis]